LKVEFLRDPAPVHRRLGRTLEVLGRDTEALTLYTSIKDEAARLAILVGSQNPQATRYMPHAACGN
jgi:hypothetical protein